MAEALKTNSALTSLGLEGNLISDEGARREAERREALAALRFVNSDWLGSLERNARPASQQPPAPPPGKDEV